MKFRNVAIAISLALFITACDREDRTGRPETETTGSIQSEQQRQRLGDDHRSGRRTGPR